MTEEQTPQTAEQPATEIGPITVPLKRAIQAHGATVKELKFREPTGADIEACGVPVQFTWVASEDGGGVQVTYNAKAMTAMMSLLAAVPPSSIKMLYARDWITCAMALQSFFLPD